MKDAYFHLPGLFEFIEFYELFLPLFFNKRHYFYDNRRIASIYGCPKDVIWSAGRVSDAGYNCKRVLDLVNKYDISPRLTFSNSLINTNHLLDERCNMICRDFSNSKVNTGIIIYSDLLLSYLKDKYPSFYYISSTTKVLTDFNDLLIELDNKEYDYVVPDFRLNKNLNLLSKLDIKKKAKIELLCNECCPVSCLDRKKCYETVSKINMGHLVDDFKCKNSDGIHGYCFSESMKNPSFISNNDIDEIYLNNDICNFKIEGRSLGSAILLEILLYYLVKPEYQLNVREEIYLNNNLDLF